MPHLFNMTLLGLIENKYTVDELHWAWQPTFNHRVDESYSLSQLHKFCLTAGIEIYKRIRSGDAVWAYFLEDLGEYVRQYVSKNVDANGDPIAYLHQIADIVDRTLVVNSGEIKYTSINLLMAYYVGGWFDSTPFKKFYSIDFKDIFKLIEERLLAVSERASICSELFCHALFTTGVGYSAYIKFLINLVGQPGFSDLRFERFVALKLNSYLNSVERYAELHCFYEKKVISNKIAPSMRTMLSILKEYQSINEDEKLLSLTTDYKDFWRMMGE